MTSDPSTARCDCIASGHANKPRQHGADPHAKNCAIYTAPRCASGRHVWTDPADAAKCCRPEWRRQLAVGAHGGALWFRHSWQRVPAAREP